MNDNRPILESYVKLALAIDQHAHGYVDAYFGPQGWRTEAEESDPVPLMDLIAIADDAIGALSAFSPQDNQRRVFMSKQLQSMRAILHILAGNRLSVRDETLALYDIETEWCDESEFIEAQYTLDQLLPSGGSLYERAEKRRAQTRLSREDIQPLIEIASKELRERTKKGGKPISSGDADKLVTSLTAKDVLDKMETAISDPVQGQKGFIGSREYRNLKNQMLELFGRKQSGGAIGKEEIKLAMSAPALAKGELLPLFINISKPDIIRIS